MVNGVRRLKASSLTSAFDNAKSAWLPENALLRKYLTDSIRAKC